MVIYQELMIDLKLRKVRDPENRFISDAELDLRVRECMDEELALYEIYASEGYRHNICYKE